MIETRPLNKLILSPLNVRKTGGETEIASLAQSIVNVGLLQNLIVCEGDGKKLWEVVAGGRRLRALEMAARDKAIPRNHPVPVKIVSRSEAIEISLTENLHKEDMNPADQVEAFAAIVERYAEQGITDHAEAVANCARLSGYTPRFVEQRLRLAALAPEILDALRDGELTIAAAQAYGGHPDHKIQLSAFQAGQRQGGDWGHKPNAIADRIAGKIYPVDHKAVKYIGLDAYREAGGRIEADLFFEEAEREVLLDPAIVDRLAKAKAETEAQQLAQAAGCLGAAVAKPGGQSWQEPTTPKGYERRWREPSDLADDERAEAIAAYRLKSDGSGVEMIPNVCFIKQPETDDDPEAEPTPSYDYEARRRRQAIELRAARMAFPETAGTPFAGLLFWPPLEWEDCNVIEDDEGNKFGTLSVDIRLPWADIEAHLDEAERLHDAEEADEPGEEDPDDGTIDDNEELGNPAVNDQVEEHAA